MQTPFRDEEPGRGLVLLAHSRGYEFKNKLMTVEEIVNHV